MYHYVRQNPDPSDRLGFNLSVTPEDFAQQMDYLVRQGYHAVSLEDLNRARAGAPLPARPVVISFDDGYADAFSAAYPVLRAKGLKGTFFVVTSFVGRPGYLTWEQILEMAKGGMEIGSHTVRHPDLTLLAPSVLKAELRDSRRQLEEKLNAEVRYLAYPAGRYNQTVLGASKESGYVMAVTTEWGYAHPESEPLRLPRVRINGGTPLSQFASLLP